MNCFVSICVTKGKRMSQQVIPSVQRPGLTWAVVAVAGVFTVGSVLQLFLAGMGTFESGTHWNDHVFLGRIVSLFALMLPVLAIIARLTRPFIVLSSIAAVLYIAQVMFTYINIGPVAALHAINALPLIIIPALIAMRAWDLLRAKSAA
jgi:hypothetical protein